MSLVHQYLTNVVAIPAQCQLEALMEAVLPVVAERRRLIELSRKCVCVCVCAFVRACVCE